MRPIEPITSPRSPPTRRVRPGRAPRDRPQCRSVSARRRVVRTGGRERDEDQDSHHPHREEAVEDGHPRPREAFEPPEDRGCAVDRPIHVGTGDRTPQEHLRQPRGGKAGDDLQRHQGEKEPADERDRRRHREAVRQAEKHHEKRERPVAQDGQKNLSDGDSLAGLGRERRQDGRSTCFRGQDAQQVGGSRPRPLAELERAAKAAGVTPPPLPQWSVRTPSTVLNSAGLMRRV